MEEAPKVLIKGRLEYHGMWEKAVIIHTDDGPVNIWDKIHDWMTFANQRVVEKKHDSRDHFELQIVKPTGVNDMQLEYTHEMKDGKLYRYGIWSNNIARVMTKGGCTHGTNTFHYFSSALESLNSRNVYFFLNEESISIQENDEEGDEIHEVKYFDGNTCFVSDDDAKSVCGIGTTDCCIFASVGSKSGFSCLKFSSSGRMMLDRHHKGTMNATRIGSCKCTGRWEENEDPRKLETTDG